MQFISEKMGIIALKTSYNKLPWYKKIFFPWPLARLLNEKRDLLTNSKENHQYALRVYNAYSNSWDFSKMIFSSLRYFSNNPIVSALETLGNKQVRITSDQFVFMGNHDDPKEFANKIKAVLNKKCYGLSDVNKDQIKDWIAAGVNIDNLFLYSVDQNYNNTAEKLIVLINDKATLQEALLKAASLTLFKMILDKAGDSLKQDQLANLLLIAIEKNRTDIAPELIKKLGKIDFQDHEGNTPLHRAASQNRIKIVGALLKANANVDIMNAQGYTPYMIAKARNHEECAEMIAEKNPEINVKSWATQVNKIKVKQDQTRSSSNNCHSFHHRERKPHRGAGLERFVTKVFHLH